MNLLHSGLTFVATVDSFDFCFKGQAALDACKALADFVDGRLSSVKIAFVSDLK